MLKMDFLGLTTLTVIHDALAMIEARGGGKLDMQKLPLDDAPTYRMLRAGRTAGVFQFESALATDQLRNMRCDRFDDLVASNALMRPGPLDAGMHKVFAARKRGDEPVTLRAARAARGARAHLRRDHLSGTGDAHRAAARRHLARRSRRAAQSRGQEGRRRSSRPNSTSSSRRPSPRATRAGSSRSSPASSRPSAATASTSRTRWRTRSSPIKRRGSRRTTPPSSWRRCSSSQIGDADSVVKYINEARELGTRSASARREREPATSSPSSATSACASDSARSATWAAARSIPSSRRATAAPSTRSSISSRRSTSASATGACSRRSSRPARSTRSAATARSTPTRSTARSRKRRSARKSA